MIFYIETILDLIEKYNETREKELHIDIFDVYDDIDNLEDEKEIHQAMHELEKRI